MMRLPALSRGWRTIGLVAFIAVFTLVLADPTPDPVPVLGAVPPVALAAGWAVLAFGWVWMVAGVARGLCWLRGEASCRLPRDQV